MRFSAYIDSLTGAEITVIGIGVSNTPLIKKLLEHGCRVTARDRSDREKLGAVADKLEALGARLILGPDYLRDIDADIIFRTPGVRPDRPEILAACEKGAVLTSEMEAFFEVCPCRIIAVTGSDGKTTTTTIISELLKAAGYRVHLGGNIGRPLLCEADSMSRDDIAVLELSSFQLMTMSASPDVAVVTNLAPNHLDVHTDMDEYVRAKKNIFLHQTENGKAVFNADNDITAAFFGEAKGKTAAFSRRIRPENGACLENGVLYVVAEGVQRPVMYAKDILIPGEHNVENYLAAFAAVDGLVTPDVMQSVARTFGGVEHRIELVRELRGVKYYNDSIASSPSRTRAGLRSFDRRVILIAGGKDKGVPFDGLGRDIREHVSVLVLTGFTAEKIERAVVDSPEYDGTPRIIRRDDFREAVLAASGAAQPGDIVILSPACTSFDHFRNFEERGRFFKEIVSQLE